MIIKLSLNDFIRCLHDGGGNFSVKTVLKIDFSSAFLQDTKCSDDWSGHSVGVSADIEVLFVSLGLSGPKSVSGDLNGSEGILFLSELGEGVREELIFFKAVLEEL